MSRSFEVEGGVSSSVYNSLQACLPICDASMLDSR